MNRYCCIVVCLLCLFGLFIGTSYGAQDTPTDQMEFVSHDNGVCASGFCLRSGVRDVFAAVEWGRPLARIVQWRPLANARERVNTRRVEGRAFLHVLRRSR